MAKLHDTRANSAAAIGDEAILQFIDEINEIRARSGNRFRFRPIRKPGNITGMDEHLEIERPRSAHSRSQRFGQ